MFGGFKKYRACINAMNAKITWESLSEDDRRIVRSQATMLYVSGGKSISPVSGEDLIKMSTVEDRFDRFSEFERYSIYSAAMDMGYIPPSTPEPWDPPRNPFTLRITQRDIEKASLHFKRNHGIGVTLKL